MNSMQNGPIKPPLSLIPFFERKAANDFRCPFFCNRSNAVDVCDKERAILGSQLSREPLIFCGIDDDELSESGIPLF